MDKNDTQLIVDFLNDEANSFDFIVFRYTKSIYNFVFRMVGNKNDAEDITQDVFVKIWKNIKKFDQEKNFKTWVFAIARNTTIDWLRNRKNVTFSSLDTDQEMFEETISDILPLPDEIFSRKELVHELEIVLDKISIESKTIVFLHLKEDMTFEEIAEIVKKPMNTIKSQYRRTLHQIRGLLRI